MIRFALALFLGCAAPAAAQSISLPAPEGPYGIGYWSTPFRTDDLDRLSPEPDDRRELLLEIWYPAAPGEGAAKAYATSFIASQLELSFPFPPGFSAAIQAHAVGGAAIADGQFPVIVFSPGLSWPVTLYQSLTEDLASRGFIVVGVNSPHVSAIDYGGGRVRDLSAWPNLSDDAAREAMLSREVEPVAEDLRDVVRELGRWSRISREIPVAGHLDVSRLGLAGHSYGASAATRLSDLAGLRGIFLMEGLARTSDGSAITLRRPLLHMIGGYNRVELEGEGYQPSSSAPLTQVVVNGTGHANFSDLIYLYRNHADAAWHGRHRYETDAGRVLQIARDYIAAFYGVYLRDEPPNLLLSPVSYAARVSGPTQAGYPEVDLSISIR